SACVTGGARGEGGTDFTGSFETALAVTPCASSRSQQRWNTALSDKSLPRTSGTLSTTAVGIAVTKSCPATAAPNSVFTCTFSVQNLDPGNDVLSLSVKNRVPLPGGSAVAVQCKQGGVQVFALGPNGGATDTCTGSVDESTPACAATSTNFADRVSASGSDTGQFVFGFAEQTVVIP